VKEFVPDPRFADVARRIIDFAHERLDDGSLFESNIPLTERRADVFENLLAQYEDHSSISLSQHDAAAVIEAHGLTEHILSDHLGRDVLAHRLGHNEESIAAMRVELEVLKPIVDTLRQRAMERAPKQQERSRGMGR
jgi:hypothetical protein